MPEIAYCHNSEGYYTHTEYCTVDPLESAAQGRDVFVLPADACLDAPVIAKGCVARRVNGAWVDVENHADEKGFINGVPTTIEEYGPLPEGWSATPPPSPTEEQLFVTLRASRDVRLADTDKYLLADYPISEGDLALVKTYRAAIRALPEQPGAPWDGGGDETPWHTKPEI